MFEIFALVIYSVQWFGVVLGVGAQTVLLVGYLMKLHARQPQWLEQMPAVRMAQGLGLLFIIVSGLSAIVYQVLVGEPEVLFISTFGFKWILIGIVTAGFYAERRFARGRAALEGFAGATWYALFLVHSVAPIFVWVDFFFFYAIWLVLFGGAWSGFVLLMKHTGKTPALYIPKPTPPPKPVPPPPQPKPIPPPPPPQPKPVPPPPPPPAPKPASPSPPAPVVAAKPSNLPAIEPLELMAPHVAAPPTPKITYKPDYDHIPGLRIMPQRLEDLHLHNRAPVVQTV
ncbi:MAG: hypothetical protein AAB919_02790 [Patescibacteria group bacterium]